MVLLAWYAANHTTWVKLKVVRTSADEITIQRLGLVIVRKIQTLFSPSHRILSPSASGLSDQHRTSINYGCTHFGRLRLSSLTNRFLWYGCHITWQLSIDVPQDSSWPYVDRSRFDLIDTINISHSISSSKAFLSFFVFGLTWSTIKTSLEEFVGETRWLQTWRPWPLPPWNDLNIKATFADENWYAPEGFPTTLT